MVRSGPLTLCISTLCAAMATACADAPPRNAAGIAGVGCYALVRRDSPAVSLARLMPDTVELDSAARLNPDGRPNARWPLKLHPVSHRRDIRIDTIITQNGPMLSPEPDWDRNFVLMGWRFTPPRRVDAVLHQNMGPSWNLHFRIRDGDLLGRAEYYDDGPLTFSIPLIGKPVACRSRNAP